jgi:hypothetical protein
MQIPYATGLDRKYGGAKWRDLRFPIPKTFAPVHNDPSLCHLDRSEAQWRDLCVDTFSWKCFSTGVYMGLRLT